MPSTVVVFRVSVFIEKSVNCRNVKQTHENETTLRVSPTAFYSAIITVDNTDCSYGDEILVEFFHAPEINQPEDYIIKCANEPYTLEVNIENIDIQNIWIATRPDLVNIFLLTFFAFFKSSKDAKYLDPGRTFK